MRTPLRLFGLGTLAAALVLSAFNPGTVQAAGSATLSLDNGGSSYPVGTTFSVVISENSGGELVNAVQADLSYDASKFQYLGASIAGGAFTVGPAPSGGNGSVSVVGGSVTSYTGSQVVGTVTFKAIGLTAGSNIVFKSSSAIVRTSDSANLWNAALSGGSYAVTAVTNSATALMGDVSGDAQDKADAVMVFKDTGTTSVSVSSGTALGTPTFWSVEPRMAGADKYFLGDVNNDDRDDLVGFWNAGGIWKVMTSAGTAFQGPPTIFAINQGIGTAKQWVADVSGDGRADTLTFDPGSGDWYASLSTGSGFGPNQTKWTGTNGIGSNDQAVADFTGDGKADIGVYFAVNGSWYITPSGVTPPFSYQHWSYGHGLGSTARYVGDVNGDDKTDEAFFYSDGRWRNGMSGGGGFYGDTLWAIGQGVGVTTRFITDINGDGMDDLVTYDAGQGDWNVDLSSGGGFWPPSLWIHGHGKLY